MIRPSEGLFMWRMNTARLEFSIMRTERHGRAKSGLLLLEVLRHDSSKCPSASANRVVNVNLLDM